jgi:hypothetical protein
MFPPVFEDVVTLFVMLAVLDVAKLNVAPNIVRIEPTELSPILRTIAAEAGLVATRAKAATPIPAIIFFILYFLYYPSKV